MFSNKYLILILDCKLIIKSKIEIFKLIGGK